MLTHIQTVGVQVSDQDEALDFYINTLGFEKLQDTPMDDEGGRWIEVAPPGAQTRLVLSRGYGSGEIGGFTGFVFGTDDIAATCEALESQGVEMTAPLRIEPWGKWAQFADPDGNEFGIWAPADDG